MPTAEFIDSDKNKAASIVGAPTGRPSFAQYLKAKQAEHDKLVSEIGADPAKAVAHQRLLEQLDIILNPTPLHVVITREPFLPWFNLVVSDGTSYECEAEEARQYFRDRGANMDVVEKALDYCQNFYKAEVRIKHPKTPPRKPAEPKI